MSYESEAIWHPRLNVSSQPAPPRKLDRTDEAALLNRKLRRIPMTRLIETRRQQLLLEDCSREAPLGDLFAAAEVHDRSEMRPARRAAVERLEPSNLAQPQRQTYCAVLPLMAPTTIRNWLPSEGSSSGEGRLVGIG